MTDMRLVKATLVDKLDSTLYGEVHKERIRAHQKHDDTGGSMERKSWLDPAWLPVLVEEVGEVAKELCDFRHGEDDIREYAERLRTELIQVAAMASAWVDAIDSDVER